MPYENDNNDTLYFCRSGNNGNVDWLPVTRIDELSETVGDYGNDGSNYIQSLRSEETNIIVNCEEAVELLREIKNELKEIQTGSKVVNLGDLQRLEDNGL